MNHQATVSNQRELLQQWLHTQLFDSIPCSIAVIDSKYKIVENNRNFVDLFGDGNGKFCYEAYKGQSTKCKFCSAEQTFQDGQMRVNDETGLDRNGKTSYYIVHVFPIFGEKNNIEYVVEMSIDVTETKHLQKEYRMLFDHVPCYVSVINRDLRIVRENEAARNTFGDMTGKHCYEGYKRSHIKCETCPAEATFHDGAVHKARQVGISKEGVPTSYMVATSPLSYENGKINHVIEIALDITEKERLESELNEAHAQLSALIESSIDGVIVVNAGGKIALCNPAASIISGYKEENIMGKFVPEDLFPEAFKDMEDNAETPLFMRETQMTTELGKKSLYDSQALSCTPRENYLEGRPAFKTFER